MVKWVGVTKELARMGAVQGQEGEVLDNSHILPWSLDLLLGISLDLHQQKSWYRSKETRWPGGLEVYLRPSPKHTVHTLSVGRG